MKKWTWKKIKRECQKWWKGLPWLFQLLIRNQLMIPVIIIGVSTFVYNLSYWFSFEETQLGTSLINIDTLWKITKLMFALTIFQALIGLYGEKLINMMPEKWAKKKIGFGKKRKKKNNLN